MLAAYSYAEAASAMYVKKVSHSDSRCGVNIENVGSVEILDCLVLASLSLHSLLPTSFNHLLLSL